MCSKKNFFLFITQIERAKEKSVLLNEKKKKSQRELPVCTGWHRPNSPCFSPPSVIINPGNNTKKQQRRILKCSKKEENYLRTPIRTGRAYLYLTSLHPREGAPDLMFPNQIRTGDTGRVRPLLDVTGVPLIKSAPQVRWLIKKQPN